MHTPHSYAEKKTFQTFFAIRGIVFHKYILFGQNPGCAKRSNVKLRACGGLTIEQGRTLKFSVWVQFKVTRCIDYVYWCASFRVMDLKVKAIIAISMQFFVMW